MLKNIGELRAVLANSQDRSADAPTVAYADADEDGIYLLHSAVETVGMPNIRFETSLGNPRSNEEWSDRIGGADGLLLGWRLPRAFLERTSNGPNLKVISFLGTGVADHVDLGVAVSRGITVLNATHYADVAVAEHALALLLAAVRGITHLDKSIRSGEWPEFTSWQLSGRRLGIIGLGSIGRAMARLGASVGMEIVGWNRSAESGVTEQYGIRLLSLRDLMASSDAVSVHVALTEQTEKLIDGEMLSLMKPGSVLVNTARGKIVDEGALGMALAAGKLRAAGCDVFSEEPVAPSNSLLTSDRTVLTPHVAYNTEDASKELFVQGVQNLITFFQKNHLELRT
jgi:D-3-phosphoglycerate dehydrogenase